MARASRNPIKLLLDGFDWAGRSGRLQFFYMFILVFAAAQIVSLGMETSQLIANIGWIISALLTVPFFGHLLRRLNDLRLSGWFWLLSLVPGANLLFLLFLLLKTPSQRIQRDTTGFRAIGMVGCFFLALVILSRVFWTPYLAVSGAMKPSILIGDIVVGTHWFRGVERADVVVVSHPVSGAATIFRVVGIPGDRVQMRDGALWLNGVEVDRVDQGLFVERMERQGPFGLYPRCYNGAVGAGARCEKRLWREEIDGRVYAVLNVSDSALDNTAEITVPAGHIFVLGDNRDNAADSRISPGASGMGVVQNDAVRGLAKRVLLSFEGPEIWHFWTLRPERTMMGLQ